MSDLDEGSLPFSSPEKGNKERSKSNSKGKAGKGDKEQREKGSRKRRDKEKEGESLGISEENVVLRKHLRKQEEKIKILATKLVKIVSERKNKEKRDEIMIEEQKARIAELEGQVAALRDKLQVSREQLASYTKLIPTGHQHYKLPPGGNKGHGHGHGQVQGSKVKLKPSSARPSSTSFLDHEFTSKVEQLLLEAKAENQALEDQLRVTRERLGKSEKLLETKVKALKVQESAHQEELLKVKGQVESDADKSQKKKAIQDNIALIRLQRESRRTSSWLSTLEAKCRAHEASLAEANETIASLEAQIASLQEELRDRGQKAIEIGRELESASGELSKLKEIETEMKGLSEENRILRETNQTLVDKSLSTTSLRGRDSSAQVQVQAQMQMTAQIAELQGELERLESRLKAELTSKAELWGQVEGEKGKREGAERALAEEKREREKLRREFEGLKEDLQRERERREEKVEGGGKGGGKEKEMEDELSQAQWQLVQMRDELDKTRALLRTQMMINKECQKEVETLTGKLDRAESFHHQKLAEFMDLLEQRTRQMSLLETKLESIKVPDKVNVKGPLGDGAGGGGGGGEEKGEEQGAKDAS